MRSAAFNRVLQATGYLAPDGEHAKGLVDAHTAAARLRPLLVDERVGLKADAVFCAGKTPTSIFKDAGRSEPTSAQVRMWHEAAWNVGIAPLLWIIAPTTVRLHNCYASPLHGADPDGAARPLREFPLESAQALSELNDTCGRLATETGAFWSSTLGTEIDRRHRVDRELLAEISALEDQLAALKSSKKSHSPARLNTSHRDFAQRLIGRCIFTWYLIDRGIAQRFLPATLPPELARMFGSTSNAFRLFDWLRATFNGDLFPMDDPGAEREWLHEGHLELVRDFVAGTSLRPEMRGQRRLFRFRFEAIPVDLISSIYQQFARSSAVDQGHALGLHYTPVELVHLTLDPVFERLPSDARVIDVTCGSGAFLVEAFRRLVWRKAGGGRARRSLVRRILYNQLYGIDINRSALGIAAFSLYLAALELTDDPISDAADLKFDRLIGSTLFEANATGPLPSAIEERPFDAVVGNPPWTFYSRRLLPARKTGVVRPRRSPDQEFLNVAARLAGDSGRVGMVMKASPFFSRDPHAINSRNALLNRLNPVALLNLSALRKEGLFPDATGPALIFFARCALMDPATRLLVGSVPWTPDFGRNGVFHLGPGELHSVSLDRVIRTPALLKARAFGTARDMWLLERLEREFLPLKALLARLGIDARGQGYKIKGNNQATPPNAYYRFRTLTPDHYTPFRVKSSALPRFAHAALERPRDPRIFRGPLLIVPKASFAAAGERGRHSAAVSSEGVLFTENFYGMSFAQTDLRFAYALSGILNSSVTAFQLAFGGGNWGLERATVQPNDLLALRVPDLMHSSLESVIAAEAAAAAGIRDLERLAALDDAVFELYGLDRDEMSVARDSVFRARMLISESYAQRQEAIKAPSPLTLSAYAEAVIDVVGSFLRAQRRRHLEATIYGRPVVAVNRSQGTPGLMAVRFTMRDGPASDVDSTIVQETDQAAVDEIAQALIERLRVATPPYISERRQIRVYLGDALFIIKPNEARYWSRTAGLNDADLILADHWIAETRGAAGAD